MKPVKRSYILLMNDGSLRRITVPAQWKITFGSLVPYIQKQTANYQGHIPAFRMYDSSKENLRVCLTGVTGFYEETIEIQEGKYATQHKSTSQKENRDGRKDVLIHAETGVEWQPTRKLSLDEPITEVSPDF